MSVALITDTAAPKSATAKKEFAPIWVLAPSQAEMDTIGRGLFLHGHQYTPYFSPDAVAQQLAGPNVPIPQMLIAVYNRSQMGLAGRLIDISKKYPEMTIVVIGGEALNCDCHFISAPFTAEELHQLISSNIQNTH